MQENSHVLMAINSSSFGDFRVPNDNVKFLYVIGLSLCIKKLERLIDLG